MALVQTRFNFTMVEAGNIVAIPIMIVNAFTPILGWISDRINRRGYTLAASSFLLLFSHIFMASIDSKRTPAPVIVSVAVNVIGYSLYVATIWAVIPAIASRENLGFAIGMFTCF